MKKIIYISFTLLFAYYSSIVISLYNLHKAVFLKNSNLIEEYIEFKTLKLNLNTFIQASIKKKTILDHVIFYGPPGLGKTTLAKIVSNEKKNEYTHY